MADQNVNEDVRLEENQPKPLTRDEVVHALTAVGHLMLAAAHQVMCGIYATSTFEDAEDVMDILARMEHRELMRGLTGRI